MVTKAENSLYNEFLFIFLSPFFSLLHFNWPFFSFSFTFILRIFLDLKNDIQDRRSVACHKNNDSGVRILLNHHVSEINARWHSVEL